ncbi:uncharacterized protein LOC111074851 [Drosophila obscura]|uniref:uncharacterized protein LOC111074851 n=1 Tax=Drosophila obscura TaxID=7282 RepID=UPI001BB23F70|nr:uncharacterized protein LOC111074851 [Drosophila obscura]XP_022223507.2 uncharacterized protein LOC111074851 [Drosophila obscura]
MQFITNHPFGPNGPYYRRACLRDRFPSLLDEVGNLGDSLVSHLGSSNIENMNGRLKRGRKHTKEEELHDANELCLDGPWTINQTRRQNARTMQRACDRYAPGLPRYPPEWASPQQSTQPRRRSRSVPVLPTAKRQSGEPPYEGKCDHCRRQGTDDVLSDIKARTMAKKMCEHRTLSNQHHLLHVHHNRSLNPAEFQ